MISESKSLGPHLDRMRSSVRPIPISLIDPDPDQPRRSFNEAELLGLGQNILKCGQQVPIIVFSTADRFALLDGERRWRAASLANITELSAVVMPAKPSATELHVLRMSIDVHKVAHSAMERSDLLHRIQAETGWSITELAEQLGLKQPQVSKYLAMQNLCPDVRAMLNRGEIDIEKAFTLSREQDAVKQTELAVKASQLSRDQLRRHVKASGNAIVTAGSAHFTMPGGMQVGVKGKDLSLTCAIELLSETVRLLKKGLAQGLDINTQMRVMRDRAKLKPKSSTK